MTKDRKIRPSGVTLLIVLLSVVAFAQTNVEPTLRKSLSGKTLVLRTPYESGNLRFGPQGKLLNSSNIGMLPTDGLLLVEDVSLEKDTIRLEGRRIMLAMRTTGNARLTTIPTGRKFKLSLQLDAPATSQAQIMQLLNRVFVAGDAEQLLENYWKPSVDISLPCSDRDKQGDGVAGLLEGKRPVYRCVIPQKVTAPKAIHSPEPNFSLGALKEAEKRLTKLRLIVNEGGLPELLGVINDPSNAAAAESVLAVSRWRFTPATRNGQPVAVIIDVEIEAHSY
jgi:hypothetical protein